MDIERYLVMEVVPFANYNLLTDNNLQPTYRTSLVIEESRNKRCVIVVAGQCDI